MKKFVAVIFLYVIFFLLSPSLFAADNSRSDSVDVLDYHIHLNVTDYAGKTISGSCTVSFKSKINNLSQLDLDLQKLTIDSIIQNDQQVTFSYDDQFTIHIQLLNILNTGDSSAVIVYYRGKPINDSGGWGGWYWSGDYSFSIGVALNDIPHTFGRSWYPCVDNFVERSAFHFSIVTTADKMALCNGALVSSFDSGNGTKTWNWEMLETIPSYLACVAVNKYTPAYGSYIGLNDTIPIWYGAIATDTTKMKNSFIHLPNALKTFEDLFGYYRWNKVGYAETTVGAMEHSTMISYPYFLVNGNTAYENIMAHELAHQWFGNLVTCRTAEDMWLNEGWAEYGSFVFLEMLYGKEKYNTTIAANHEEVVHYAHTALGDGGYLVMNNIPQTYTYGKTVYYKGADMAHTLRGYMGDSLFFQCLKSYLSAYAFRDADSKDLMNHLTACSGTDLSHFFYDWIFQPGWASFTIDSVSIISGPLGIFNADVFLRQRLNHAPQFYNNVPIELYFYDENLNVTMATASVSGNCTVFSITLPFAPVYVGLDLNEKISDAVTADLKTLNNTGNNNFVYGKMNLNVHSISDSVLLRIEHIYAAPDPFKSPIKNLHLSQERFWKVDGIVNSGFDASCVISYNGASALGGYLDNNLISNSEDSLVVLYRKNSGYDWKIETDVVQNTLVSKTDKKGNFTINHLKMGEYTLGIFQNDKVDSVINYGNEPCNVTGISEVGSHSDFCMLVYPNPATGSITIQLKPAEPACIIEIYNLYGARVYYSIMNNENQNIPLQNWGSGVYLIKVSNNKYQPISSQIFTIN